MGLALVSQLGGEEREGGRERERGFETVRDLRWAVMARGLALGGSKLVPGEDGDLVCLAARTWIILDRIIFD